MSPETTETTATTETSVETTTERERPVLVTEQGPVRVERLPVRLESDDRRVITLPFTSGGSQRLRALFKRIEQIPEDEVEIALENVTSSYDNRHNDLLDVFREHYRAGASLIGWTHDWPKPRKLLAGAYLTMEYAIESAALFNPSIVPHPDQSDVPDGALRFVMSLRATGEGHVSSIVFRTGIVTADYRVEIDPPAHVLSRARFAPDRHYLKELVRRKTEQMGLSMDTVNLILEPLPDRFTIAQLHDAVDQTQDEYKNLPHAGPTVDNLLWLARSNYHIGLSRQADLSELVIFPMSESESRGIEDLRLVQFTEDDGSTTYFGTYTAYNGLRILPMLVETDDFKQLEIHSLNGNAATNKGMALFPRRIGGHYVMCSRIDGENLYISYSDYVHFWETAEKLVEPRYLWELKHVGNCGSPIETPEGWLLLTHGVGPMRAYCIGAMLLDLDDPMRIKGHLREPLLTPIGEEREGYVPNVVYTCGAMRHRDKLVLPYALADKATAFATIGMDELINRLLDSRP